MEQLPKDWKINGSRHWGRTSEHKSPPSWQWILLLFFLPYLLAWNQKQSETWNCPLGTERKSSKKSPLFLERGPQQIRVNRGNVIFLVYFFHTLLSQLLRNSAVAAAVRAVVTGQAYKTPREGNPSLWLEELWSQELRKNSCCILLPILLPPVSAHNSSSPSTNIQLVFTGVKQKKINKGILSTTP